MTRHIVSQPLLATALTLAMMLGLAGPSNAAEPPFVIDWADGVACPNFPLRVEIYVDTGHLTFREFIDKNGNGVRFLVAGQNSRQTFINMRSGSSYQVKAEGTAQNFFTNPDGSQTWVLNGHSIVSYTNVPNLPPDPNAPATIRYIGRLVLKLDSSGTSVSVPDFKGKKTDICAALS
jgi:hypothetical protein